MAGVHGGVWVSEKDYRSEFWPSGLDNPVQVRAAHASRSIQEFEARSFYLKSLIAANEDKHLIELHKGIVSSYFGGCLFLLRSCLDFLAYELCARTEDIEPQKISFPILRRAGAGAEGWLEKKLELFPEENREDLRRLGKMGSLRALNHLNNIDKHRFLLEFRISKLDGALLPLCDHLMEEGHTEKHYREAGVHLGGLFVALLVNDEYLESLDLPGDAYKLLALFESNVEDALQTFGFRHKVNEQ
jgi:hypothetical protein